MALSLPNTFLQRNLTPLPRLSPPSAKNPAARRPNRLLLSCRKKGIHPEFHVDAKVYCNGELVMTTGGTKKEYVVDVWSGNHPFYLGTGSQNVGADSPLEKFRKKYPGLPEIMKVPVLRGEIVIPPRRKSVGKGGKKK